ncbi:hypothetical protein ACB092_03G021600 [Castanea dentata]
MENSLYGNLPLDIGLSCPNLETLYLGSNKLSGHIQSDISNCSNLALVDFAINLLSGPIPRSLGNLKYLRSLNLILNLLSILECLYIFEMGNLMIWPCKT